MRVECFRVAAVAAALLLAVAIQAYLSVANGGSLQDGEGRRVALVIGNARYHHTSHLPNSPRDANDVAAALQSLGFLVTKGIDLNKAQMVQTITQFADGLRQGDAGVFYYAGHGLQANGQNYLVPVDAKLGSPASIELEAVKVDVVQGVMQGHGRIAILFLDACRNNPLTQRLVEAAATRGVALKRGLAAAQYGRDTLISFATQPDNVALDGEGRNSPFTAALVRQMLASEESVLDMLTHVRIDVLEATSDQQVPWEHSSLTRKFYFRPHAAAGAGQAGGGQARESRAEIELWTAAKDSRDPDMIRRYVAAYPKGAFVAIAKEILAELDKGKRVPAAVKTTAFDGRWKVVRTGKQCPRDVFKFEFMIGDGAISGELGPDWTINGSVTATGDVELSHEGKPHGVTRYTGTLKGSRGNGSFSVEGGMCRGTFTAKRK